MRTAIVMLVLGLGLVACGGGTTTAEPTAGTDTTAPADGGTATAPTEPAGTPTDGAEPMASDVTLATTTTDLGEFLVDGEGMTLYLFLNDQGSESTCYDQCAQNWPALTGSASAGEGVDGALIGTTTREDGSTQVTYNGHPLYHFANDSAPGDTNGQGVGDVWYVVGTDGEPIQG